MASIPERIQLPASGGQSIVLSLLGSIIIGVLLRDVRIILVGVVLAIVMLYLAMPRGKRDVDPAVYSQYQVDFVAGNRARRSGAVALPNGATFYRFYSSNPSTSDDDSSRPTPSDRQLVICLHGFSTSSFCWDKVATSLENAGYEVLTFDAYGRGLSGSDDSKITPKLLVSQVAHLLLQLFGTGDIRSPMLANGGMPELATIKRFQNKPIVVMGWSMGGVVATHFALMYPSLVQRLVLVAPAGFPVVKPPTAMIVKIPILRNLMVLLGPGLMLKAIDQEWAALKSGDKSMYEPLRGHFVQSVRSNAGYMRALVKILSHFPLENQESEFRLVGQHGRPILVLWGTDDTIVPYRHTKRIAELLPSAKLVTIEAGGHGIHMQRSDEVNRAILSFLQQPLP